LPARKDDAEVVLDPFCQQGSHDLPIGARGLKEQPYLAAGNLTP
jgi:hypothetical protein